MENGKRVFICFQNLGCYNNNGLGAHEAKVTVYPEPGALSKEGARTFCQFLRDFKFLDGYTSNFAKSVSSDGTKVQGLKTHDCHILLQTILAARLRGQFHDKDNIIYNTIACLGKFFKVLCSKTLKKSLLHQMKLEIPEILCELEFISPLLSLI